MSKNWKAKISKITYRLADSPRARMHPSGRRDLGPRKGTADMEKSSLFRSDRWLDTDKLDFFEAPPMWASSERPADPLGWRVRMVLALMKPNQAEVLEDYYFLGFSHNDIAERRRTTRQAVSQLLRRAEYAFQRLMVKHGPALRNVPEGAEL